MQVFTGDAEMTSVAMMLKDKVPVNASLDVAEAHDLMEIEKLSKTMTEIRAHVAGKATRDRKAAVQKRNDKSTCVRQNFK
jgi:hypothetical protein